MKLDKKIPIFCMIKHKLQQISFSIKSMSNSGITKAYTIQITKSSFILWKGMNQQRCGFPRGKALGGTSVINYMIYNRGHR